MAHRLPLVAVGVAGVGDVIVLVIVCPQPRRLFVAATMSEGGLVKCIDAGLVLCQERDMRAVADAGRLSVERGHQPSLVALHLAVVEMTVAGTRAFMIEGGHIVRMHTGD